MSCLHPVLADYRGLREDGKKHIKILSRFDDFQTIEEAREKYQLFGHQLMFLPCGTCPACLKVRKRQWSVRCQFEALEYEQNCFITLTYDEKHCPKKLIKRDKDLFIKSLRNKGFKFRYFGCGEYGSITGRPHYHLILFGWMPPDCKPSHKSDSGYWQYTSKIISDSWKKGLCTVADFSPETAGYVAGYVEKKLLDDKNDSFIFMSNRPGIGREWIESHLGKVYSYDSLVVKFGSHIMSVPRYFDKVAEANDLYIEDIKEMRMLNAIKAYKRGMHDFQCFTFEELFAHQLSIEEMNNIRRKRGL